jgi:hypothetical protein
MVDILNIFHSIPAKKKSNKKTKDCVLSDHWNRWRISGWWFGNVWNMAAMTFHSVGNNHPS